MRCNLRVPGRSLLELVSCGVLRCRILSDVFLSFVVRIRICVSVLIWICVRVLVIVICVRVLVIAICVSVLVIAICWILGEVVLDSVVIILGEALVLIGIRRILGKVLISFVIVVRKRIVLVFLAVVTGVTKGTVSHTSLNSLARLRGTRFLVGWRAGVRVLSARAAPVARARYAAPPQREPV
jgi:hypothetical protein